MPSGSTIAIGAGVGLLALGLIVGLSGSKAAAAPAPTPPTPPLPPTGGGGAPGVKCPLPQTGTPPKLIITHLSDSGSTVQMRNGDVLRTSLLKSSGADWVLTSSNPNILAVSQVTTGPDPTNLSGTDRVYVWRTQGYSGTVTIYGSLMAGTGQGMGQPIANFTLTVQVSCGQVAIGAGAPHILLAGKTYVADVYSSSTATVPALALAQAALPPAAHLTSISNPPSNVGVGLRNTSAIRILIVPSANVGVTNAMLARAAGIMNPVKTTVQMFP